MDLIIEYEGNDKTIKELLESIKECIENKINPKLCLGMITQVKILKEVEE